MKKEQKIIKLVEDEKIFKMSETEKYHFYICKGSRGEIYDIFYMKESDDWSCNCKNIRLTPCYHIEAAKVLKENNLENEVPKDNPLAINISDSRIHSV